jgi:nucleotide-binding universal stress UspA family protein
MDSSKPAMRSDLAGFILNLTDFSPPSELAFAHALRLAVTSKAMLTLIHVGESGEREWDQFPAVRQTLERWGLLQAGSRRADIGKLGVQIEKVIDAGDVMAAISRYSVAHPVDLLVLAAEQRSGLAGWLKSSVAERAARSISLPTLFVPARGRSCVSMEDGSVTMNQVLIPVDHAPRAGGAIERGLRAIRAFGNADSRLTLLHVGKESEFPDVHIPSGTGHVARMVRQGSPVTEILAAAEEITANLIIMVTQGADGFLDALRGTTTEKVLRHAPCPVLAVPADF